MTETSPESEEVQLVLVHLMEQGIELDSSGLDRLAQLIESGRERVLADEGDDESFRRAVEELAERLPDHFKPGFRPGARRRADAATISEAFRSLCPIWPFC